MIVENRDDPRFREFLNADDYLVIEHSTEGVYPVLIKHRDYKVLYALDRRPGLLHVAGDVRRVGVGLFTHDLEHRYFPPGTVRNAEFLLHSVLWEGLAFSVVSIPAKCRRFAERVASRHGLRLADGVPHCFSSDHPERPAVFPMKSSAVFTLEFVPGSPLYRVMNDPELARQQREAEALIARDDERRYRESRGQN